MHYLRLHPAYYNDFDAGACAWLRELIRRNLIAPGDVDERSILDVSADDLRGYTQCHFFAGIGGWSYALRLTGWPDDKPVWTGSPPCQPFSSAGRQKGQADARHLAPHFISLVGTARPPMLFGEQVASAAVFGPAPKGNRAGFEGAPPWAWLDDLSDRLEAAHYAVGASDIPAAGVSAFHERQRTFFGAVRLADSNDSGLEGRGKPGSECSTERSAGPGGVAGGVADSQGSRRTDGSQIDRSSRPISSETGEIIGTGDRGSLGGMGDSRGSTSQWDTRSVLAAQAGEYGARQSVDGSVPFGLEHAGSGVGKRTSPPDSPWATPDWLFCRDGKWRPVESGAQQMVDGIPEDLGYLRLECSGENKNGATSKTGPSETLSDLRHEIGAETLQRAVGGHDGIQEAGLLRSGLHGAGLRRPNQSPERQELTEAGSKDTEGQMRTVRAGSTSRPSQGLEPGEQRANELGEPLRFLSQTGTPPPGCFPLANGVKHRAVLLRGYGNAIVPQVAAEFIRAFCEVVEGESFATQQRLSEAPFDPLADL